MRVLVAYGSIRGGTEGIAEVVGEELAAAGLTVDVEPASKALRVTDYDAVVVGGSKRELFLIQDTRSYTRSSGRDQRTPRKRPKSTS